MYLKQYACLLAAGTTEGLEVMKLLDEFHIPTAACVATELGASMLEKTNADVYIGRMDEEVFEQFMMLHHIGFVIDATHPFAVEVTKNLKQATKELGISYIRYARSEINYDYNQIIHANDARDAAKKLVELKGNVLLTTGANTAAIYKEIMPDFNERVYIRVLDTQESLKRCKDAGIDESHVIALNPPFTVEDNNALIEKYNIRVLVSKDSGRKGGLLEKIESAKNFNIPVVLVDRPEHEDGLGSVNALRQWLEEGHINVR